MSEKRDFSDDVCQLAGILNVSTGEAIMAAVHETLARCKNGISTAFTSAAYTTIEGKYRIELIYGENCAARIFRADMEADTEADTNEESTHE